MGRANSSGTVRGRDVELTERQSQVLRLITDGKTNAEIGEALGISLDGAKWHVSEILSKLGVSTREEAAEYWRARTGLGSRAVRVLRSFVPGLGWLKVAGGVAVVAGVSAVAIFVVVALRDSGTSDEHAPARPPTTVASASAASTTPSTPVGVTGLFAAPAIGRPSVRVAVLGARPDSSFKPWDGRETVIYDVVAGREIDLGEGSGATFSADSRWAGWIAGPETTDAYGLPERIGEAWVMNLETGEKHDLGRGRAVLFDVAPKVAVFPPERGRWSVFDYQTGRLMADQTTQGPLGYRVLPDGNQLWTERLAPITPVNVRGGSWTSRFSVRRGGDQSLVMDFEAMTAMPAGPRKLLVVMPPVNGDSNLFMLDLTTGEATPLTSARPGVGPNWPISASGEYALWTDDFCSERPGNIELFDFSTGTLTEIRLPAQSTESERFVLLTPGGQIAQGSFGAKAIIDSKTLAYLAVLPAAPQDGRGSEPAWSSDYRYASYYRAGHGGLCSG